MEVPTLILDLPRNRNNGQNLCQFHGCKNRQYGLKPHCEAHCRQLVRKGTLAPLAGTKWQPDEIQTVKDWYEQRNGQKLLVRELAEKLNRPLASVFSLASELGLGNYFRKKGGEKPSRKWSTDAESRAAISRSTKAHIAKNGHPCGMAGKKHSPETIAIISVKSKAFHSRVTKKQRRQMNIKSNLTKIALYGTAGPPPGSTPYSRTKGGKRADLGDMYFRSGWEANYARYLNWLVAQKVIKSWKFEVKTFRFEGITRGTLTYTPDFEVEENNGDIVYHEVKGWMDAKSKTRLKRMKKYHPTVKLLLIDQKQYKAIEKMVSKIIPHWEFKGKGK